MTWVLLFHSGPDLEATGTGGEPCPSAHPWWVDAGAGAQQQNNSRVNNLTIESESLL